MPQRITFRMGEKKIRRSGELWNVLERATGLACICFVTYDVRNNRVRAMQLTTEEILNALKDRGLTQVEIAKRTGIPQYRLSRWQNGEAPKTADDALRLRAYADTILNRRKRRQAQAA